MMKYKVGDKVRVKNDLEACTEYGDYRFVRKMKDYRGKVVTISKRNSNSYRIEKDNGEFFWTDEMFEDLEENELTVEEELTAEEAIKLKSEMCGKGDYCSKCKFSLSNNTEGVYCDEFLAKHPEQFVEFIKQRKKDNEKKEIKTEIVDLIKVMKKVCDDETCIYAYEIDVNKEEINEKMKELVKEYSNEQNGKIYAKYERICKVKNK